MRWPYLLLSAVAGDRVYPKVCTKASSTHLALMATRALQCSWPRWMAEQAIHAQLTGVAALGDRVYPLVLPQNVEYPAATFQRIGATRYSAFRSDASIP